MSISAALLGVLQDEKVSSLHSSRPDMEIVLISAFRYMQGRHDRSLISQGCNESLPMQLPKLSSL